jgi:hypothetical protein
MHNNIEEYSVIENLADRLYSKSHRWLYCGRGMMRSLRDMTVDDRLRLARGEDKKKIQKDTSSLVSILI